jgi:hypothetical protein
MLDGCYEGLLLLLTPGICGGQSAVGSPGVVVVWRDLAASDDSTLEARLRPVS